MIISRRHVRKLNTSLSPDVFLNNFNFYLQNKLSNYPIKNNDRKKKIKIGEYAIPWTTITGSNKWKMLMLNLLCLVNQSNRYSSALILGCISIKLQQPIW